MRKADKLWFNRYIAICIYIIAAAVHATRFELYQPLDSVYTLKARLVAED